MWYYVVPVRSVPLLPGSGRGSGSRAGVLCVGPLRGCVFVRLLWLCVFLGGRFRVMFFGLCFPGGFFAGGVRVFEFPDPVAEGFEGGFAEFPAECFGVVSGGVSGDAGHDEEVAE